MSWSPSSGCSSRVLGVPNKPFAAQNSVCIITVVSFKEVFEADGYFFCIPKKTLIMKRYQINISFNFNLTPYIEGE